MHRSIYSARVLDPAHQLWRKITMITVRRTSGHCAIVYGDNLSHMESTFAAQVPVNAHELQASTKLVVDAMLRRDLIIGIAMDLKKLSQSQELARSAALQRTAASEQRSQPGGQ
jgi:hypothetical protein